MGREIRHVPADWSHPRNEHGHFIPLVDKTYKEAITEWERDKALWADGKHPSQVNHPDIYGDDSWEDYDGGMPLPGEYRSRQWSPDEATHLQVYETVSEGTPVSPIFPDKEALIAWLVESEGYTVTAAARFAEDEWAPSMIARSEFGQVSVADGIAGLDPRLR